jgi:hypothetical protein
VIAATSISAGDAAIESPLFPGLAIPLSLLFRGLVSAQRGGAGH